MNPKIKTPLGIESTTYGYNFNSMLNFHWGAGRLSRGIGHVLYKYFKSIYCSLYMIYRHKMNSVVRLYILLVTSQICVTRHPLMTSTHVQTLGVMLVIFQRTFLAFIGLSSTLVVDVLEQCSELNNGAE